MVTKVPKCSATLPMWAPESSWVAPDLSQLPSWEGQSHVGYDCEFDDPTLRELGLGARRGVVMAGYSFAFNDGRKFYIPLRHPEGNVNVEQGMAYLRDQAKNYKGELTGANLPVELDVGKYEPTGAIVFPQVKFFRDVQIAAPLIYELYHTYNLEVIAERLQLPGKDESLLKRAAQDYGADITKRSWKAMVPKLPAKYVGPYGEHDAWLPLQILKLQTAEIERLGLEECWDLESRLLPVLLKMRQRGVRIDFDQLDKVEAYAKAEEKLALEEIKHITGVNISPGDTMKVGAVLPALEAAGLHPPVHRDEKSGEMKVSIDGAFLDSCDHKVAELLRRARKTAKLHGTFVTSVRRYVVNGRLHPTLRQIVGAGDNNEESGAAFGRLSSCDPNIQQQPSRDEFANEWRKIYVPEEGAIWGCCDLKQQEPRWTTHYAALLNLKGGREAAQAYRDDVKLDNHDFMARITGLDRTYAKQIYLGLSYRQGGAKLCAMLGLPTRWAVRYKDSGTAEFFDTKALAVKARREYEGQASYYEVAGEQGQAILDQFNDRAPYISELAKVAQKRAEKTGEIRILSGRRLHFPTDDNGVYTFVYKALNRLIQGTSGYQVKQALVDIDREMPEVFLQLQVHDEVDASFTDIAQAKKLSVLLRNAGGDSLVPFLVDIEVGPSWGSMKLVCGVDSCHNFVDKSQDKYYCPSCLAGTLK